jgi:AraC-like DNA-binding protein
VEQSGLSAFQRVDTSALRSRDRFDYWRSIHPGTRLEPISREAARDFQASNLFYSAPGGTMFSRTVSIGTRSYFGENNPDLVLFSRTTWGAIHIQSGHAHTRIDASTRGLLMLDCRQRARVMTAGPHTHMYVAIPRRRVIEALGEDTDMNGSAARILPDNGLFPFLRSHMRMLAARGAGLSAHEADVAVDTAVTLALSGLQQLRRGSAEISAAQSILFLEARRQIALRHGEHGLTATDIAASLGCSRAHLYRAFASHGASFAAMMREIRLEKARAFLRARRRRSIAAIAYDCGYGDVASFGRAFRARFGFSPAAWRDRHS